MLPFLASSSKNLTTSMEASNAAKVYGSFVGYHESMHMMSLTL
jgi:hypothetical protein